MRISYAIQAHPQRAEMAEALALAVGGDIVYDPDPTERRSPWRTYRRALEETPEDATHRFVIQDDAVVCDGFSDAAARAIDAQPDRLLVMFVAARPMEHARQVIKACHRDLAWAELDYLRWCPVVATCWPATLIGPLLEFVDKQTRWPERFQADDEIVGRFIRSRREVPLATVPSLVQHPDTVESVNGGRRAAGGRDIARTAICYVHDCEECDPASIDWSSEPLRRVVR